MWPLVGIMVLQDQLIVDETISDREEQIQISNAGAFKIGCLPPHMLTVGRAPDLFV